MNEVAQAGAALDMNLIPMGLNRSGQQAKRADDGQSTLVDEYRPPEGDRNLC